MLTKKQFDILERLIDAEQKFSQRELSQLTGYSLGAINSVIKELSELNYVEKGEITTSGIEAMQVYRVRRAVIIAAGFGSRLVPITLNTPKPLVRVKGNRIIDSCLDALKDAGISEIYIIRGYLAEQFDQLLYKYPNIKFIENPMFNEANNLSSIVCAGDLLQGAYVAEADLLLRNKQLIKKYQYSSNYLGIPVSRSDDWVAFTNSDGYISGLAIGGKDCYQIVGISYWTVEDGKKLFIDARNVFNSPGGKERYWDQVPLQYCIDNYKVTVRPCTFDDVVEIDTYTELKRLDETYR